jgi:hypothetical protein
MPAYGPNRTSGLNSAEVGCSHFSEIARSQSARLCPLREAWSLSAHYDWREFVFATYRPHK